MEGWQVGQQTDSRLKEDGSIGWRLEKDGKRDSEQAGRED